MSLVAGRQRHERLERVIREREPPPGLDDDDRPGERVDHAAQETRIARQGVG